MNQGNRKIIQPVKAYIRQRPMNKSELESKCDNIIPNIAPREVTVKLGFNKKKFNFDHVFGADASQADVYNTVVSPLISHLIAGFNCTVLAFGQTGSGKSHTIVGDLPNLLELPPDWESDPSFGIIPRLAYQLFSELYKLNQKIEYTVRVSFIEVYNEEVHDLLKDSLPMRLYDDPENKGSVYIKGLTEVTVHRKEHVLEHLKIGMNELNNASANFNARKSRSHTIFTFLVNTREINDNGDEIIKTGKFHLVDLAGSENLRKAGAREAGTLNKSISCLGKVIKALSQKVQHIPYRDSKLTRILQDSLGGSARTCMIGTICPASTAYEETVVTLEYASFVRNIANSPHVNINRKRADFLKALKDECDELQRELQVARSGQGFYVSRESYEQMNGEIEAKNARIIELLQIITELEDHRKNKEAQYRALNESFQQSKEHLETIAQELEAKKQKVEQNRRVLNYMRSREQELDTTANHLLQVCKTSTKCEDIYHSKYETLCNATLTNADLAKKLTSATANALSDVQQFTEKRHIDQKITLNNLKETIDALTQKRQEHLEAVSHLLNELELKADAQNHLNLEEIFKNETTNFSEENLKSFFNRFYEFKFLNEHNEMKESLKDLKNYIERQNDELKTCAENCSQLLLNKIDETSKFRTSLKGTIQKIQKIISKREALLEPKKNMDQSFYATMRKYFQSCKEYRKEMSENKSELDEQLKEWQKSVQQHKEKNQSQLLQESLKNYFDHLTHTGQEKSMLIGNVMEKLEEVKSKTESQAEIDTTNIEKYLSELENTVQGNLSLYNQGLETLFKTLADQANALQSNVIENAQSASATIEANIGNMSKCNSSYDADIKKSVQESCENFKVLKNDAVLTLHAGDTPVKNTYEYPKHIPSPIPLHVLLEEANGEVLPDENA